MARTIYVDADACPVKAEVYTVAERHRWPVVLVANSGMMIPRDQDVRLQLVPGGLDAADDWIAAAAGAGDVVVTADVPLADRCIKAGARVVTPTGRILDAATIGPVLATRDLLDDLRSAGAVTGGPRPFGQRDRQTFLQSLDREVRRAGRDLDPLTASRRP